jgi:amino acid transporter
VVGDEGVTESAGEPRPAFYALSPGGWRDYWTLLHPPYTLWHLSYVAIGAALAPELRVAWWLETTAAFFLAMGVAAHALDELNGRPLRTRIPRGVLIGLAVVGLAGALAIGVHGAMAATPWIWR